MTPNSAEPTVAVMASCPVISPVCDRVGNPFKATPTCVTVPSVSSGAADRGLEKIIVPHVAPAASPVADGRDCLLCGAEPPLTAAATRSSVRALWLPAFFQRVVSDSVASCDAVV